MILNIQFQVAGLILVILVIAILFNEKKLHLYTESVFGALLATVLVCIGLDITSVFALNYEHVIGKLFMDIVCKLYLISINAVAYELLKYALAEVHKKRKNLNRIMLFHAIPLLLNTVLVCVVPIYKHLEAGEIYTYGPAVQITYVTAFVFLVDSVYHMLRYRNRTTKQRRQSVWFLLGAWLVAASIQMFHNELLLIGFTMGVGMVFMYMKLENPENNVDKITDSFNIYAYFGHLNKLSGMDKDFGMLAISLSGLQFIRENFGMHNANAVLKKVADYLRELEGGKVFRDNESEFIVVFDDKMMTEAAVEKLKKRFLTPWIVKEVKFQLEPYIAYIPSRNIVDSADDVTEVIHYFMEECKRKEPGTVVCINEEQLEQKKKVSDAEKALRQALENDSIQIHYQPVYSVEDGKFVSLEAVVSLADENEHYVMSDVFVPLAEQNGMISELGKAVFRKVCRFMQEEHPEQYGIEYIDVNLSVIQCMQDDLAKQLLEMMEAYNIPPYRFNFEITEAAVNYSESILRNNMNELLKAGASTSLGDYGSGFAGLRNVIEFPFQKIKLDKEIVSSYFKSEKAQIAMSHLISMVKEIGMQLVAEGVENEEQYSEMKKLTIDFVQGSYFSKPKTEKDVILLLQKWM